MGHTPRIKLNATEQIQEGDVAITLRDARGAVTPPGKKSRARARRGVLKDKRSAFEAALMEHRDAVQASEPDTPPATVAQGILAHAAAILARPQPKSTTKDPLPNATPPSVAATPLAPAKHTLVQAVKASDPQGSAREDDALVRIRDGHPEVVLFAPQIPPNTGTVARLCAALQARLHLVEPLGFDVSEKAVRRAGLDYWSEVDITVHGSLDALRATLPDRRLVLVETGGTASPMDFEFAPGDLLVFGSETTGLPQDFVRTSVEAGATLLTIPMHSARVRSINLANTVSMVLFVAVEKLRQAKLGHAE